MKKIINKKTLLKLLPYLIVFGIATFLFFQTHVAFLLDSEYYYKNATVILGLIDKSDYFAIRGFGYPLYLSLFIKIFGNNFFAITLSAYVIYILIIILAFYIVNLFLKNSSLINKIIIYILFLVLIICNTLIIGYSSLVLTENISILIMEIVFVLLYKWINMNPFEHKIKAVIYVPVFGILMIYIYQCKQTMAAYMLLMMFIAVIFDSIKKKKLKEFIYRFGTIIVCLIFTYIQIGMWSKFLNNIKEEVGINGNETNSIGVFSNSILGGSGIVIQSGGYFCNIDFVEKNKFLSNEEKEKLKKYIPDQCDKIVFLTRGDSYGKIADEYFIVEPNQNIYTPVKILFENLIRKPQTILGHYYNNYLWMINVYGYKISGYNYVFEKEFTTYTKENGPNGMFALNYSNTLWRDAANYGGSKVIGISNFSDNIDNGKTIQYINNNFSRYYLELFKYTYLAIPFLFIFSCVIYIKNKKKEYSDLLFAILTLSGSSFGFALFLAFTGQTIDRYAYVSYPLALISIILCFICCKTNLTKKNDK